MAISRCVVCKSTRFEVKETKPEGSAFKLYFAQCAAGGGVVGVTEFYNTGALIETLAKKLGFKLS
jgi:hypothetical protein